MNHQHFWLIYFNRKWVLTEQNVIHMNSLVHWKCFGLKTLSLYLLGTVVQLLDPSAHSQCRMPPKLKGRVPSLVLTVHPEGCSSAKQLAEHDCSTVHGPQAGTPRRHHINIIKSCFCFWEIKENKDLTRSNCWVHSPSSSAVLIMAYPFKNFSYVCEFHWHLLTLLSDHHGKYSLFSSFWLLLFSLCSCVFSFLLFFPL